MPHKFSKGPYFIDGNKIVCPAGYNIATINSHATTEGKANAILLASSFEMRDKLVSAALVLQSSKSEYSKIVLAEIEKLLERIS